MAAERQKRPCRCCGVEVYNLRESRRKRWDYLCPKCEEEKGWKGTLEGRALSGWRVRAMALGVPFDLDESVFPSPDECPACGVTLERGPEDRDTSPSLDRIISDLGYTKGNVVWLCNRCNRIKTNATVAELYMVADWLWDRYKERGLPLPSTRLKPIVVEAGAAQGNEGATGSTPVKALAASVSRRIANYANKENET